MTSDCSPIEIANYRRPAFRWGIALLVLSLFVAPCFVRGTIATRAVLAFIPVVVLMIAVESCAAPANRIRSRERWRIRRTSLATAQLFRGLVNILLHAVIAGIALSILLHPGTLNHPGRELLRFGSGAVLLYAVAGIISAALAVLFLIAGYSLPIVHRYPVAARSVEDFWARRWNILVSAWLHAFVFLPLARRRHYALGIMCAFLVSGAFHGWPVLFALGIRPALIVVLFFIIQGAVILVENRLRIQTWPTSLARVWTVIIILGTSPLFVGPGLRLFGL